MRFSYFLLISLLAVCSSGSKMHSPKKLLTKHPANAKTALLKYTGSIKGSFAGDDVTYQDYNVNLDIGIELIFDSSIGLRGDFTFVTSINGKNVMTHNALFYKFSKPYQTIFYSYNNRTTEVTQQAGVDPNPGNDENLKWVGTANIDSFSCIILNHKTGKTGEENYWMSTSVPGFKQLCQILKSIDPSLMSPITGTVFNYGGLVRMTMNETTQNGQATAVLNLTEAQTDLKFRLRPSDFEVPTK